MTSDTVCGPRDEETIVTRKIVAERKLFYIDFKRNQRGLFLKITEKDGRFKSTVIVPEEVVQEFSQAVRDLSAQCATAEVDVPLSEPTSETIQL